MCYERHVHLIEYEFGLVLSKTYNLKKLNHLPHRDNLIPYYEQSIRILTEYKITLEELQTGKIKPIYKRLSLSIYNWSDYDKIRCKLTFNDILPNYLKTFNYRTVWNLLPFSHELGKCALCKRGQDSAVHLFVKCSVTQQIWKLLNNVLTNITRKQFTIDPLTPLNFCFPNQLIMYSEAVALLVTATNRCIWQTRVQQLNETPQNQNPEPVNHRIVLAKIFTHKSNRQKKEKQQIYQTFIDTRNKIQASGLTTKPLFKWNYDKRENLNNVVFFSYFLNVLFFFITFVFRQFGPVFSKFKTKPTSFSCT